MVAAFGLQSSGFWSGGPVLGFHLNSQQQVSELCWKLYQGKVTPSVLKSSLVETDSSVDIQEVM